ncbi:hypothetical protein M1307_01325, partial [Patescibacteria group bacterium]|nr:hypothetical protein [Patescibacteria group bacterium]
HLKSIWTIGKEGAAQKYTSYITKDGKLFFTSGVKIADLKNPPQAQAANTPQKLTCSALDKSAEKPSLTAFLVSNCPYGLQMQRVFSKALGELSDLSANLDIRYIGSIENDKIISMHGDVEAQENLKQICIREEQQARYWNYVSCYMQEGKSEGCSATAGIDTQKLTSCTTDLNRGFKYAKADFDLGAKLGISSSPTLVLNGKQIVSEFDFGGRIPNAIKEIVGCSYKTKPDLFAKDISKDEVATAFSQTGTASSGNSGSGSNAAQCAPAK